MVVASVPTEALTVSSGSSKQTRGSGLRERLGVEEVRRGTGSGAGGVGGTHALCPHHGAGRASDSRLPMIKSSEYWLLWCNGGTAWKNSGLASSH